MNLEQKISELQERNKGKLDNAEIPELWAEDTYKALYLFLDQITTTSYQAGIDEAVENMTTQKRWRKMLEGLGRGFAIYITPAEKELLLLSLREVDTLQEARQKTSDDTIKALQDNK